MSDSKNVNVEGSIDAGFTQYGVPKQTSEDENGEINTEYWPQNVDRDEVDELRERIIETAFKNPTLTTFGVAERADTSQGSVSKALRKHVPEWYNDVFKAQGASTNKVADNSTTTEEADESPDKADDKRVGQHDSVESETQETDVKEILGVLKATAVHQETKQALDVLEGYL